MIKPKSLQQRFAIFMLLPVAILLFSMGLVGFIYARDSLLDQWGEASMLKLERAAHQIDMRLGHPKDWMRMVHESADLPHADHFRGAVIHQLEKMEGVVRVRLTGRIATDRQLIPEGSSRPPKPHSTHGKGSTGHGGNHRNESIDITPPHYDSQTENRTVSIVSEYKDEKKRVVGRLEVVLRFDYLLSAVAGMGWWQSDKAFIVDHDGHILTGTSPDAGKMLGENGNALEARTLAAMREKPSGTVIGKGYLDVEVSGFHRLTEAPWFLVMFAPADEILAPIRHFSWFYIVTGAGFIFFILLLIRLVTGRTVSAIKNVTRAAGKLAGGERFPALEAKTRDEVGELIRNFNSMALQLEERLHMKQALGLAMDVQRNLLPKSNPLVHGLDIAGISRYCDETGGDYYDFFLHPDGPSISVAVGDVSGHGIPAALLMATVRAILRQHTFGQDDPGRIISDVNNQLVKDVEDSGRFVTLLFLEIDSRQKKIRYVRAGHDPAFVYDPGDDSFRELSGKGLPLGVMESNGYEQNISDIRAGQILVIGTDGIWETRNAAGDLFGKKAFQSVIRSVAAKPAEDIIHTVLRELDDFRCPREQEDDITLVIIKIRD
ncbi:MAG: SpoIIE family protein phosphatase [Thermodesulfobacteriota bacterium]